MKKISAVKFSYLIIGIMVVLLGISLILTCFYPKLYLMELSIPFYIVNAIFYVVFGLALGATLIRRKCIE